MSLDKIHVYVYDSGMGANHTGGVPAKMSEVRLADLWQRQIATQRDFISIEGAPLHIIYPGRPNGGQGPDRIDAVIAKSGSLLRGDIEFHVKSSSWWEHRHHLDPAYNRVILHVVSLPDRAEAATLADGRRADTLALGQYPDRPKPERKQGLPGCGAGKSRSLVMLGKRLDALGDERFLRKAERLYLAISQFGVAPCLYQEIMDALGYAKNRAPFREVARRLPLDSLELHARENPEALATMRQACLLGTAGLLPSQRGTATPGDAFVTRMETLWADMPPAQPLLPVEWNLCGIRPANLPARRLAAMSHLVRRLFARSGVERNVREMAQSSPARLVRSLMVPATSYWRDHLDFGLPAPGQAGSLLGAGRASDIAVNVVLPFALALARRDHGQRTASRAISAYLNLPGLPANSIERHMSAQLGLPAGFLKPARRQQGALHLYREYCSQGRCVACPLAAGTAKG